MTTDLESLLCALQYGDSFFPSGAVSFSWGLERLREDGVLSGENDLQDFIAGQLRGRWAMIDRPVLLAAHRACPDLAEIARIDRLVESLTLPSVNRDGSRRAGAALLGAHESLVTPHVAPYYDLVKGGDAPGHLAVAQGLVLCGVGLPEDWAAAVSGHGLIVGYLGAALRLGLVGHIASQRCLAAMRELVAEILATPPCTLDDIGAFTPQSDIAAMRHDTATLRLFTT